MRHLILVACVASLMVGPPAYGQSKFEKDSVKNCDKVTRTIDHGRPLHEQAQALQTLLRCGPSAAPLFAQAISGTRSETDTTALGGFYQTANEWRDFGMMNAALTVASDAGATTPARVYAITHLLKLISPRITYSYSALVQRSRAETANRLVPCIPFAAGTHASPLTNGVPLPPNYANTVAVELLRIADDASAPVEVRYTAACSGVLPQ